MQADLVFTGGPVHLGNAVHSRATAVAVTGERIVAVGHAEVAELVGPGTEVVDLAGRLLIPGFQDAHVHPVGGGLELGACDLTGAVDLEEYRARISAYAAAHPDAAWITGGGWSMETLPRRHPRPTHPRRAGARPAGLPAQPRPPRRLGQHPRPGDRRHRRATPPTRPTAGSSATPDGTPTGTLQEGAMQLVAAHVPGRRRPRTCSPACCGPRSSCTRSASPPGRTPWSAPTAGIGDVAGTYRAALDRDLLTARVVGALWWERDQGLEQLDGLLERPRAS